MDNFTQRPAIDIRPQHWEIVRTILQMRVPEYEVWAFGSRARRQARQYSALYWAIVTDTPMSIYDTAELNEEFSESDLPWKVDVVDWARTSPAFRTIIANDKVILQRGAKAA